MYKRYHKKVFFLNDSKIKLKQFTEKLNHMNWIYSNHCIDNLKYRAIDKRDILLFIKDIQLNADDIFEYYTTDKGSILKVCYRIKYTKNIDIILVVAENKKIVTIYMNTADDEHITLNENLYVKSINS